MRIKTGVVDLARVLFWIIAIVLATTDYIDWWVLVLFALYSMEIKVRL